MGKEKRHIGVVLLGGKGRRFDPSTPKQFIFFLDKPLFLYPVLTLDQSENIDEIYIVTKPGTIEETKQFLSKYGVKKVKGVIEGGERRQDSSRLALEYLASIGVKKEDIVLIQDGDRPNLNEKLIDKSILEAEKVGASVVAIPSTDSIFLSKEDKAEIKEYLNRAFVYRVQTPQTFRFGLIYEAHKKFREGNYTDDASLLKECGKDVAIVEGSEDNFKINTKEDGEEFLSFLERRKAI